MEILDENNLQIFGQSIQSSSKKLNKLTQIICQNLKEYFQQQFDDEIQIDENDSNEVQLKKLETLFDRQHEIVIRGQTILKTVEKIKKHISILKECLKPLDHFITNELQIVMKKNNDIIDELIAITEIEMESKQQDDNKSNVHEINNYTIENYRKYRCVIPGERINKEEKALERHKEIFEILNFDEMKQIEEWTNLHVDTMLFNSEKDDWSMKTSVFDEKIKNKSNLIFLIEDFDGNKFGVFIMNKIDKYRYEKNGNWMGERIEFKRKIS